MVAEVADAKLGAYALFTAAGARLRARLAVRAEETGVAGPDVYEVLSALEGGRLRLNDLADRIGLSRSGLTRRLDRLEREGLVEREGCEEDRRGSFAVLTSSGRRTLEEAGPAYREAVRAFFTDRMSEGEARQLGALMKRVVEALERA